MGDVVWGIACGGAGVVGIVERLLLVLGHVVNQVVGGLVGHVGVLLGEQTVGADGALDFVLGILGVLDAEGSVRAVGTGGWLSGVTVASVVGGLVTIGWPGGGHVLLVHRAESNSGTRQKYRL